MRLWVIAVLASIANGQFSGSMTYYNPAGGIGKCGNVLQDMDYIVSMNPMQYQDGLCGAAICITFNGKSVRDRCAGCAFGDIDISAGMFMAISSLDVGRVNAQWSFCDSAPAVVPSPPPPPIPCVSSTICPSDQCGKTIKDNCGKDLTCSACSSSTLPSPSPNPSPSTQGASIQESTSTPSAASSSPATNPTNTINGASPSSSPSPEVKRYAIPLNAPVVWPSTVNSTKPLAIRRGCF
ncbi:hypothetical protein BDR26DRAFT_31038 [Obelidium mucronatum]|nr:hypothetical protein BDR26DRAFT_31038 [Obelidium mucronatum]